MEKQDEAREGISRSPTVSIPEGQNPHSFVKVHNHTRTGTPCGNPVRGTGNQVKELVMIDPTQMAPAISPAIARPTRKPVGITKGPGESTHEYTFVSRDDEQELKNGEYVYYELTDP